MAKIGLLDCKGQALIEQLWWKTDLANCMGLGGSEGRARGRLIHQILFYPTSTLISLLHGWQLAS